MRKVAMLLLPITTATLLVGCGEDKKTALNLYNEYVSAINDGDYSAAYQLTDAPENPYMSEDVFEDALFTIDTDFNLASKAKRGDYGWNFTVGNTVYTYAIKDNKLIIPELYTSLELYVPTGASCTYNGVELSSDLITSSDELETVYTIRKAPISPGILHIDTELFGSTEREVDPEIGDYNDFTLSDDMLEEVSNVIIKELDALNTALETGDTEKFSKALEKYVESADERKALAENLYFNRKLSDPFTSYTNVIFDVNSISIDFNTPTEVNVITNFTIIWTVGEDKTATMPATGNFDVERIMNGWKLLNINTWEFMYLNGLGGGQ